MTFATMIIGKTTWKKGGLYIIVQLIASVAASIWIGLLYGFGAPPVLCGRCPARLPSRSALKPCAVGVASNGSQRNSGQIHTNANAKDCWMGVGVGT